MHSLAASTAVAIAASITVLITDAPASASVGSDPPLVLESRVELPGVGGRIDHLAWDAKRSRVAVAALGNGSVEIVEFGGSEPPAVGALAAGRVAKSLRSLAEPQGVAWLPERGELLFTTGGDGHVRVHEDASFAERADVRVGQDADNVRFDAASGLLWVGCQEGLAAFDVAKRAKVATVKLAGHAESFQLEPDGPRIFVNVPDAQQVAVIDSVERKVVATWPIAAARRNFPMAIDAAAGRLLIGCREPAKLLALRLADGALLQELPIGADSDDLFVDADRGRVYVACGSGEITVLARAADGTLAASTSIATAPGARTALFVPELARLFVAAPARDGKPAGLLVYAAPAER